VEGLLRATTALRPYFCENAKDGKSPHFLLVEQLGDSSNYAFVLITTDQVDGAGRGAASRSFHPHPTDSQRVSKNPLISPAYTVVVDLYRPAKRSSSFG